MSFLERLKRKSENEKKAIAFGVALAVTLIIGVIWFLARSAMQGM